MPREVAKQMQKELKQVKAGQKGTAKTKKKEAGAGKFHEPFVTHALWTSRAHDCATLCGHDHSSSSTTPMLGNMIKPH